MIEDKVTIDGILFPVIIADAVVVGSGAAALSAAVQCKKQRIKDVIILTERMGSGTSANTGSDKQTYYRLNPSGDGDSYLSMAKELFAGGSMHGDIAYIESALSLQAFYNLISLGIPFPHNQYGDYIGFKTDHDSKSRGTSTGPNTSIMMYDFLSKEVEKLGIPILENMEVIEICTDEDKMNKTAVGLLAINRNRIGNESSGITAIQGKYFIYGTGGPAILYKDSVYPGNQSGSLGIAIKAGAVMQNLSESQFGIASKKVRWNLSGSYQQVLPTYISENQDGSEKREFLSEYFPSAELMLEAQFLKGYQWPFDIRKVGEYGSSAIDILIYYETKVLGRNVYLDFRKNPTFKNYSFSIDNLPALAKDYLIKSNAVGNTPVERLKQMNQPAYELYKVRNIDLGEKPLEIAICNQHLNGGIRSSIWWESSIDNFFTVGECSGTHGVYRPGGSALNSGQVGALRSAEYIAYKMKQKKSGPSEIKSTILRYLENMHESIKNIQNREIIIEPKQEREKIQERMSKTLGIIRNKEGITEALEVNELMMQSYTKSGVRAKEDIPKYLKIEDMLLTEKAMLKNSLHCIDNLKGGRGSFIIGNIEEILQLNDAGICIGLLDINNDKSRNDVIVESYLNDEGVFESKDVGVRAIPLKEDWFESVWQQYRNGEIYEQKR